MEALINTLIQIIPPALLLSAAAYLVSFFGKIINDQKPYADSRKWDIEVSGLNFSIELIWMTIVGYALAIWWHFWLPGHGWDITIVAVIGALLFIANRAKLEVIYQLRLNPLPFSSKDTDKFFEVAARVINILPQWWFSLPSIYILIGLLHQGNLWWFSAIAIQVFINFTFLAINYSLRRTELPKVDIYFIDAKKEPLLQVLLIKITEDTVRVRVGDKIFLVNKSQILRIEIPVDKKLLPLAPAFANEH